MEYNTKRTKRDLDALRAMVYTFGALAVFALVCALRAPQPF